MYRIELGPDDVGVFRSIEEMATAIKTGVITPKARIYHSASDKWLPIEFHPHFKKAREMAAGPVAPAPIHPAPVRTEAAPLQRRTPLPEPSPVAGLPLIDVSAKAASEPATERVEHPVPDPVLEPAAITLEQLSSAPVAPEPAAALAPPPAAAPALWMPPALPEPKPAPPPLMQPDEPEPALQLEPLRTYAPAPVAPVFDHVPPPEPVTLPEPERDAIFLAVPSQPDLVPDPIGSPEPASDAHPVAAPATGFQLPRVDFRRRRRPILIAAAAVTLVGSTHLALTSNRPQVELGVGVPLPVPDLRPRVLSAADQAAPGPTNATVLPASVPAGKGSPTFGGGAFAAPSDAAPSAPVGQPADSSRAPVVPQVAPAPKIAITAPKIAMAPSLEGDLKSASGLVARYNAAHEAARTELDNGLRTAGFANLFATSRLQPTGLRAARAAVGTASAYVQRYRRRESEIEQAYRDSFDLLSSRNKWSDGQRRTWEGRKVQQENPEIAKLSAFLLQSLDSLYGLLAAHEAEYRMIDGSITFDDAAASRAYGELKPWLDRRAHAWADVDSDQPTTASRILKAMGTAKLPEGGSL